MNELLPRRSRFEEFLLGEFWQAYMNARKGKRATVDEHQFELNEMENIVNLLETVIRRQYKPSRGVAFIICDPVVREIVAAPFRDRVVHHFLYNCCADWWDRRFSPDSYSCRKNKGTLYGQRRMQGHIRKAIRESRSGRAFLVKLDLQGYFMSLNHEKLYQRVLWGLDRQFHDLTRTDLRNGIRCHLDDREKLYDMLKYLWHEIIFDEAMENIRIRGRKTDWKKLPSTKSLFCQPKGRGIVIGNLTSQLLSNIYMDQFDRFVTYDLGYKHYGRYVDDFYIIVPVEDKEQLIRDVRVMETYLEQRLELTLHPKKRHYQYAEKGVSFIGAVVYKDFMVPSRRSRRRCYEAAYDFATHGKGKVDGIVSRMGSMMHLDSYKFQKRLFESFGWDFES